MSQAQLRGAFVRSVNRVRHGSGLNEWYSTLAEAEVTAQHYADVSRPVSFYTGYVDSDPREHTRWQWDAKERRVQRYACND